MLLKVLYLPESSKQTSVCPSVCPYLIGFCVAGIFSFTYVKDFYKTRYSFKREKAGGWKRKVVSRPTGTLSTAPFPPPEWHKEKKTEGLSGKTPGRKHVSLRHEKREERLTKVPEPPRLKNREATTGAETLPALRRARHTAPARARPGPALIQTQGRGLVTSLLFAAKNKSWLLGE